MVAEIMPLFLMESRKGCWVPCMCFTKAALKLVVSAMSTLSRKPCRPPAGAHPGLAQSRGVLATGHPGVLLQLGLVQVGVREVDDHGE